MGQVRPFGRGLKQGWTAAVRALRDVEKRRVCLDGIVAPIRIAKHSDAVVITDNISVLRLSVLHETAICKMVTAPERCAE